MKWNAIADEPCSMARALSVVGDRWTLLILRDCFLGVRRFEEFQSRLGISKAIVASRLRRLTDEGVLERRAYHHAPLRHEYRLTRKGMDLYPALISLVHWADTYMAGEDGPPLLHRHRTCGHDFHSELHCSHCHGPVDPRDIEVRPAPGFADPRAQRNRAQCKTNASS